MYKLYIPVLTFLCFPLLAYADIFSVIDLGISFFTDLVPIFIGFAIVVFFWGILKFIGNAGDQKAIEDGKKIMIWGLVGLFVIVSMWGLVGFLQETLNIGNIGSVGNGPAIPTSIPAS